jgi:thioredoxin-dependent adenylylsulfate APS reductase
LRPPGKYDNLDGDLGIAVSSHEHLEHSQPQQILRWAIETFGDRLAFVTSFQNTGMVILDMAARISSSIRVITLDTGRLPEETHKMVDIVRERYGFQVETVFPDAAEVEAMVRLYGQNLFYRSTALRELCCEVRKVRPLERKLQEFAAWVTGLRRSQGGARAGLNKVEEVNGRLKISPLADWTRDQVEAYLREHNVPQHPLYALGYTSIGCAPCTRPVADGEPERAGRWWWEQDAAKECGIHFSPAGKVRRELDITLETLLRGANA